MFYIFSTYDILYLYIIEINQDKTAVVALTSDLLSYNGMDIPLQKATSEKFLCKICFFEGN